MKLNDLIEALAAEVELAQPQLTQSLTQLAALDAEDPLFSEALEQYAGQAQRMGEASEMAGFPGLQQVCNHVLENMLSMPALHVAERAPLVEFLRAWPSLIVYYLRHIGDPTTAAGLVDHLVHAPYPLDEERALKVMHMLGAMPLQVQPAAQAANEPMRPVLARDEDVDLTVPGDVDEKLLEGFVQEAPDQARYLVTLARNMADGGGDSSDLIAAKRVAHTLKGSGSIIGLRGIAILGHHFEDILEHFERAGHEVAKPVADALLDAAYCLEQMVGYVIGCDEYPGQSLSVLQEVLDLANRMDRGESLEAPLSRNMGTRDEEAGAKAERSLGATTAGATVAPTAALRVSVKRVEELFRVSGEVSVHTAAMETRIKSLVERSRELLAQNLRVQKRLFELETVVDVRALSVMRGRTHRADEAAFDPLEMDQYSELHGTAHALMEEAADARTLAMRVEDELAQLGSVQTRQQRLAKDLQHLVIGTRMTEAGVLESRLQRNVRSTCQATGKEAVLAVVGGETLVDSDVLNRLAEPLMHILRNAVDHGIETPAVRQAMGKPRAGRIELEFTSQGQQVVLRCRDDGAGLDLAAIRSRAIERGLLAPEQQLTEDETARLILMPGFSTRETVSEVSGRGIGLDVVRDWAASMNGAVRITTRPGEGCTIELRFAASLSTMHSLIIEVGGQRFGLPSLQVEQAVPRGVGSFVPQGDRLVFRHGKRSLPALRFAALAGLLAADDKPLDECDVVIVRSGESSHALAVDRLLDSRELLVKNPGRYARHIRGVAGLSILGDGSVAVNVDLAQLLLPADAKPRNVPLAPSAGQATAKAKGLPQVLVVDDALTVRTALLRLVEDAGYRAEAARDGMDAIETLRGFKPDILLTDLEMPNMNGIELTAHIRARDDLKNLPVIMITSRSQEKHRKMAEQAGVDSYVTKPYNDVDLLSAIHSALAH